MSINSNANTLDGGKTYNHTIAFSNDSTGQGGRNITVGLTVTKTELTIVLWWQNSHFKDLDLFVALWKDPSNENNYPINWRFAQEPPGYGSPYPEIIQLDKDYRYEEGMLPQKEKVTIVKLPDHDSHWYVKIYVRDYQNRDNPDTVSFLPSEARVIVYRGNDIVLDVWPPFYDDEGNPFKGACWELPKIFFKPSVGWIMPTQPYGVNLIGHCTQQEKGY